MRVLHLLSENSWRGGEQQAAYLINYCQQQNIESYIACRKNSAFEKYCSNHQLNYIALPFYSQFDLFTAWRIKQYCRNNKIDLIHIHSANAHGIAIVSYLLGNKIPLVLSRRVIFPIKKKWFSQFKYNHSAIKKIICVSNAVNKIAQESIKQPNRCLTIYDGIDLKKFNPSTNNSFLHTHYAIAKDTKLVGNIASLTNDKGLFTFIDAIKIISATKIKVKFFIIGTGKLREQLQNYINDKQLSNYVILTGFLNNISAIVPELDIVVMSSESGGLGSSLLEAIASNAAVVGTASGGIPEIVINMQTGLIAPVGNAEILAEQIIKLISDDDLTAKLKLQAKQHLLNHFTLEKMGGNTVKVYEEVLSIN